MATKEKIESTDEAWDTGELGQDAEHAGLLAEDAAVEVQIENALGLQLISIRLQKSLIYDFKMIAKLHGLGYQPLMRQILTRFAHSEKRRLLRMAASKRARTEENDEESTQSESA